MVFQDQDDFLDTGIKFTEVADFAECGGVLGVLQEDIEALVTMVAGRGDGASRFGGSGGSG